MNMNISCHFRIILIFLFYFFIPIYLIVAIIAAILARLCINPKKNVRLVWGSTPIISMSIWSRSMKLAGYDSETFTFDYYSSIHKRADWDKIISEEYRFVPRKIKPFVAFLTSLFRYDIFFITFDGYFIGQWKLVCFQSFILKTAGKKIVVIAYGSDSYVYRRIRSVETVHGLMMSYPGAARDQQRIAKLVDYWIKNADVFIPGVMGPDGFGRWDVLMPSNLALDLNSWKSKLTYSDADGTNRPVVIAHAPNHRGFKGTEFIIDGINKLKKEGFLIELRLLEKLQNDDVRKILREETDILVEQIICTGHGLNGIEGMASGLPTISNLKDETYTLPFRRWSYFSECPIVSATPENLVDVLRKLVTRPELRHELGRAGRAYVEKYHGLDSAQYLFTNVIDYVYGKKDSLINLYHPLLGAYPNRSPKINHPLMNNRIVD